MSTVTLEIVAGDGYGFFATAVLYRGSRIAHSVRHYLPTLPDCHAFGLHLARFHGAELVLDDEEDRAAPHAAGLPQQIPVAATGPERVRSAA